jgi:hypothetical protein
MSIIMVSYRRDDTRWITGRIYDRLEDHYGRGSVFMDIDAIPVGLDFREHIQEILERCDILLAIIGPRWLGTDERGNHAIAEESDWVRIEIETAMAKKIPVIPVLIDRMRMPKASDLPESLRNFAFRQAAEIDTGVDFRTHVDRLVRSMDQHLRAKSASPAATPEPNIIARAEPPPSAPAPVQSPDWPRPVSRAGILAEQRVRATTTARVASQRVLAIVLHTRSWIVIAGLLFVSELLALLSEGAVTAGNRGLLIALTSLPLGAVSLIGLGQRLFGYLRSRSDSVDYAIVVLGVLLIASVPTFFHATHPPDHFIAAAAWPLVLLGGLGLVFVGTALICQVIRAEHRLKWWVGGAIVLLGFVWFDSNPVSGYLSFLDWRIRSVLIFTCALVSTCILIVLGSRAIFQFLRNADQSPPASAL